MLTTLFVISVFGGFMSGLLGLGGAVIMIPLFLTIPVLVGVGELSVKTVSGLSMIQVLFASISGLIIHKKNHFIHTQTLLSIGIPMGLFSLAGSYLSKNLSDKTILIIYAVIMLIALILFLLDRQPQSTNPQMDMVSTKPILAIILGTLIGFMSGVIGVGGGFILLPVMITLLKIPLKISIGTSLGIVFIGAIFGALGKILSFQVDYLFILPIILGSLLSAQIGARISKITPPKTIKTIIIGVIVLSLIQVCYKLF